MAMLFFVFLAVDVSQLRRAFSDLRFTITTVAVNFVWTPILAYALSQLFFADSPDLWLGLFMILLTPCTDWHLVFTAQAGGDVARGRSILPLIYSCSWFSSRPTCSCSPAGASQSTREPWSPAFSMCWSFRS